MIVDSKKFDVISINAVVDDEELKTELAFLISDKKKLAREIDNLDTKIIGLKEELRKRAAKRQVALAICNQLTEDDEF